MTFFIFWTKYAQKVYFQSKTGKVNIIIGFWISLYTKSNFKRTILKHRTKFTQGVIHIVRMHKGGRERSSKMLTIAYKGGGGFQGCVRIPPAPPQFFFGPQSLKISLFFAQVFCTKEAITLPFIFMYKKV